MREALAASDQEQYFRILARSELVLPVSADAVAGRAPMGWGTWTTGNRTHILAFTSTTALRLCLNEPNGSYRPVAFQSLAAEWPNYEWWLAVNPGLPIESYLPSWFVSQLTRGDVRLPGRTMGARARMAQSDLAAALHGRLRASAPAPGATRAQAQPQWVAHATRVETVEAEVIDYPPTTGAYPPPVGEPASSGYPGYPIASATQRTEAVHPHQPGLGAMLADASGGAFGGSAGFFGSGRIDAAESTVVEPVEEATRSIKRDVQDAEVVNTGEAWTTGFAPANETESNLLVAAEENNTDAFLSTLLLAQVIVPVPAGTSMAARPRDHDFPWQIARMDGQPFISVFTSPERLSEQRSASLAAATSVSVRFVQLIGAWPSEEISFAVNPGSPVGATLPGSQIVALAAWAKDVGLREEPGAEVMLAAKKNESVPSTGVAGAPVNGAVQATVMQRTVPHTQVPFYLERGYDRVSGFVNRASEVAHLNSPKLLYRALGLSYAGSDFVEDDTEVHVVRWVAHRSDLYRLPYGGQHEAGMRAMQGWVIERPPFRGNGFAPGDTDVVAEFKVDSVRLPHGAQMWRLGADGTETLVATFDSDTTKWTPPPFGYGGAGYGPGNYA